MHCPVVPTSQLYQFGFQRLFHFRIACVLQVTAYEPEPQNFELLTVNARKLDVIVEVVQAAVQEPLLGPTARSARLASRIVIISFHTGSMLGVMRVLNL